MPSHHDYGVDNETYCGGTPDDAPPLPKPPAWVVALAEDLYRQWPRIAQDADLAAILEQDRAAGDCVAVDEISAVVWRHVSGRPAPAP